MEKIKQVVSFSFSKVVFVKGMCRSIDFEVEGQKFSASLKESAIEGYVPVDVWEDDQGDVVFKVVIYSPIVNGQILSNLRINATNLNFFYEV